MRQITDGAMCRKQGSSAASLRRASIFDVLSRSFLGGRAAREESMRGEKRGGSCGIM